GPLVPAMIARIQRPQRLGWQGSRMLSNFFFFSSRRRHTRFDCDWSSDVCSSDLRLAHPRTTSTRNRDPNSVSGVKILVHGGSSASVVLSAALRTGNGASGTKVV